MTSGNQTEYKVDKS